MTNVGKIKNCFGCGVCAVICPKKIIDINLNRDGFYEPTIVDGEKCINCGLCIKVCAYSQETGISKASIPIKSWGAWSNDNNVRLKCSSGGIGFEIAKQLLNFDYKVCGVRYNPTSSIAEHFICENVEDLYSTMGSKYIQSYTVDGFRSINRKNRYLVIGTPCQIDSFRRYIQTLKIEDNFILMDFFCHCVPSMLAWQQYIKFVQSKIGCIYDVSWRNKNTGWHDSWAMGINVVKDKFVSKENLSEFQYYSRLSKGDLFYKLFLGDICLNRACSKNCKYKYNHSSADIRIGDLWGNKFKNEEKGVSALVAFTEKGKSIVESLHNVHLENLSFETVAEGQMLTNAKPKFLTPIFMFMLRHKFSLTSVPFKLVLFSQRVINKINSILK